ncbi:MAG: hypothetical protein OEM77_06625 [Nitrosopumilus sp.]|nr:hypothetical protein [Nitrosopumilus sp.]MDH3735496.1 hypothetical protein [Nitrosopumilus sp.]MDH3833059.1 hypothetical protein [Nitrosopumilus sp.]
MAIEEEFRQMIERLVKRQIEFIKNNSPEEFHRASKISKYENHVDFWHGYNLGYLNGQIIQMFQNIYNKEPTSDEYFEIEEIFQIYEKEIIDAVKSTE